jgi:ATP-binding cassette subfamily F protein uup
LQERLAEYPGTVLLVSHDRDFLDRVVTSVIATEGNGRWIEYAGGYTDMLVQRKPARRGTPPAGVPVTSRLRPATEVARRHVKIHHRGAASCEFVPAFAAKAAWRQ